MGRPALILRDVHKVFRRGEASLCALDGVSVQVARGSVTGLIGPDGAGKTTLMRLCCGLLKLDGGMIETLGLDAAADPAAVQATVGYMPQRFGLYEDLSVQENLDLYADLQGVPRNERPARYARLMEMTNLAKFTKRLAGKLSGGMKQKLGLACALVRPPQLLLLDEPTVGVDPVSRRELWEIVYSQVQDSGMSVLLSTAYLDEAERCDEVILLHKGKVLGQAAPDSFSRNLVGRTWEVSTGDISPRRLQARLIRQGGINDAIINGDRVRIITRKGFHPDAKMLLSGTETLTVEAVPPHFEDAFIDRLGGARNGQHATPAIRQVNPGKYPGDPIEVQQLERRFGNFVAVKKVSFSVKRGEIFGLLGANGAGKTTTFRMLCGLLPLSSGRVSVAGHDLRTASARARSRIGYMAQKFSLYANLTVAQNLEFFSAAYNLRGRRQRERIQWALEGFELGPYAGVNAGTLPLGYKQRLAFAAALMHEPEILFLDEPTSGVDPLARREFWARTNALAEAGVTVLVTTHFMEEADYCDRLVIMAEGSVLAEGSPHEIRALARTQDHPQPSMEDAFIGLIQSREEAA
ncbi:ATP-binding cassette domain-containing protein [Thiolapillus brandeum]|uniref:ABC-2 type transporter ATP-binding protein n=1 Tax=Thiolapillus brandeum TaxID=1076588 RepID=A0A7U6GLB5_9GAMM|nr:ATP-binding cassette domain-containing protein [Thiolapillus brandeum]BAO45693.1 ABC-2 type transporter ATP-binding protein [Thiolapillus brandeum]